MMFGMERFLHGPVRLAILAAVLALGAIGLTLALTGAGIPFVVSGLLAAAAAGVVEYAALRAQQPVLTSVLSPASPPASPGSEEDDKLATYRAHTAALRHDLRGVLSPALMMSDRLLNHQDPAVQRAGQTVVRSIERATALIVAHKDALAPEGEAAPAAPQPAAR